MARRREQRYVLALLAVWTLVHLLLFRYLGTWVNDTGKEFGVPRDLLAGAVLYRDTFWPYGPFPPYLSAGLMGLFGTHADVLLVFARLLGLAICLVVYRTARRAAGPPVAFAVAATVLGVCTTSGCFAVPYSFATLWSCLFGLVGADCLAAALLGDSAQRRFAVAGVCCALLLLSKFTVAVFLGVPGLVVAIVLARRSGGAKLAARLLACLLVPSVVVVLPVYAFSAVQTRWDSFALQVLGGFHSFNIRHGLLYPYLWRTMVLGDGMGLRDVAGALLVWTVPVGLVAGTACLALAKAGSSRVVSGCYLLFAALNATQMNCTAHVPYVLPAVLVGLLWGAGAWRGARALRAAGVLMLSGGLVVFGARLFTLGRKDVCIRTSSASLRFAEPEGRGLARTVALVEEESPPGEPVGIFTGHDFLYQVLDRPNRLGYYYTLFEPFRRAWAEERLLRRFRDADFRLLITTERESFSYAYIQEIPETNRRIRGQLEADYEEISGPECWPYTVWRRRTATPPVR